MKAYNIVAALYSIPADCDYETWYRVGAALKSELGEPGYDLWVSWSQQSSNPKHAPRLAGYRSHWRSFKGGGPTAGTLFHLARAHGWSGEAKAAPIDPEERRRRAERARKEKAEQRRRWEAAAQRAEEMIMRADYGPHPYLEVKGFPEHHALVKDGLLLIPMRSRRDYTVQSLQMIDAEGGKKFLPGGKAGEAVYKMMGPGIQRWYCEGYATGLSIAHALRHLYRDRQSEVWVCFSAANIPKVANPRWPGYVVADNDASGTGERYAEATRLAWWMPPDVDTDANDFMLAHGVDGLADALQEVLR